jgi:ribosomal-protein-alanine N-acetyltransferase
MSAILKPAIELRPLTEADLPAVMAIETDIYAFPWTEGNFCDSIAAAYDCWTYVLDGELIGYFVVMLAADEGHLLNLSIAAARQRQGHGGILLQRLCDLLRGRGARLIFLEVRPSNLAGLRLYERHGFQRAGLRRDYYPAPEGREDALVFRLSI